MLSALRKYILDMLVDSRNMTWPVCYFHWEAKLPILIYPEECCVHMNEGSLNMVEKGERGHDTLGAHSLFCIEPLSRVVNLITFFNQHHFSKWWFFWIAIRKKDCPKWNKLRAPRKGSFSTCSLTSRVTCPYLCWQAAFGRNHREGIEKWSGATPCLCWLELWQLPSCNLVR